MWWAVGCKGGQQHKCLQSAHSLHQHYDGYWQYALLCRVCCPTERRVSPSQHEQDLYAVLTSMCGKVPEWVTEAHALGAGWGAAGVYFPSLHGLVMVDGEHHFPKGTGHIMHGESGAVQLRHDLLFNAMAVGAGFKVLRLHFQDKECWPAAVLKFTQYCAGGGAPLHFWVPAWKYIKDAQQVCAEGDSP